VNNQNGLQYTVFTAGMYLHNQLNHCFNWREITRVAGIEWGGPTGHSRDILHLDRDHSDQNVLKGIRQGRLVLVIEGQDSQTNSRDHQPPVHSDQMVLVMARQETDLHKQRPAQEPHSCKLTQDAQVRVGKQL
jgi:hypothetical protein